MSRLGGTRGDDRRGSALLVTMLTAVLVSGLAGGLVIVLSTEQAVEANHRRGITAFYAADGLLAGVTTELMEVADWRPVFSGSRLSSFGNGPLSVRLADGAAVDLPELTGLSVRPDVGTLLTMARALHDGGEAEPARQRLVDFLNERLRYVLEQRGYDVRNVRAVTHQMALSEVRPLDARRKLEVLPEFTGSADFLRLATLFKRVRNIARELSDAEFGDVERGNVAVSQDAAEPAEARLLKELERRTPKIEAAVDSGDQYRAAFAEAARFGPAVDRFFTDVLVMASDPYLRRRRLALMKRLERLVLRLADVSEIVQED